MSNRNSPALVAQAAMTAVQEGRRDDWLGHFAADARVEDPVGHLPPMIGRDALAAFWDNAISALASTRFEVGRVWEAGEEAMLLATVTIATADGASASYDGTFNYALDAGGRIATLRAFWDLPAVVSSIAE